MDRLVDLSHPWGINTPPWVGYPSTKIYYWQRLSNGGVNSQVIETTLHMGTHLDAPMHIVPGGCDIASLPMERLYGEGVIIDISDEVGEWDIIKPKHFTKKMEVRPGDILLYHTGYHHYYTGEREVDEERYMTRHPGGYVELANWLVDMKIRWTGFDCGSADHPMNTDIRTRRADLVPEFEQKVGKKVDKVFPRESFYCMHKIPFPHNIVHVENLGGDLDQVLNRRCKIGCFPWKFEGGEAAMCRVVAFIED